MPIDEIFHDKLKAIKGDKVAIRIVLEGKVQKVGLRHWIKQKAVTFDLFGWVRNRTNGSVEALFWGVEEDVGEMIKLCYQGPSFAFIRKVKEFPQVEISNLPQEFMILPTV
jgi:acylphosphatase